MWGKDSRALFLETIASLLLLLKECKHTFIIFRFNFFIICQGTVDSGLFMVKGCLKKWQDVVHTEQRAAERAHIERTCLRGFLSRKESRNSSPKCSPHPPSAFEVPGNLDPGESADSSIL